MKKMSDKIHWIDEIRQPIRLVKNIICCIHEDKKLLLYTWKEK